MLRAGFISVPELQNWPAVELPGYRVEAGSGRGGGGNRLQIIWIRKQDSASERIVKGNDTRTINEQFAKRAETPEQKKFRTLGAWK